MSVNPSIEIPHINKSSKMEKEETQQIYNNIFSNFADMTSVQGMVFIKNKKKWWSKTGWIICFLIALGMSLFQTYLLVVKFFSYDYNTVVDVGYEQLAFPSVTICNTNPVKKSLINRTSVDFGDFVRGARFTKNRNNTNARGKGPTNKRPKMQNKPETIGAPLQRRKMSGRFRHVPAGERPFLVSDRKALEAENRKIFHEHYTNLSGNVRSDAGHQASDFIIQCSFGEHQCTYGDFSSWLSPEYGNCFTFNAVDKFERPLHSQFSGKSYGLSLVLNLESDEYLSEIISSTGISLAIHPYGSAAFPEVNGLSVGPGQEALFGIQLVNITRLGRPHGHCYNDSYFDNYGNFRYTKEACVRVCPHMAISEQCSCYLPPFESYYPNDLISKLPSCYTKKSLRTCAEFLYKDGFFDDKLCDCFPPCWEQAYNVETSYNTWPHEFHYARLANLVCQQTEVEGLCDRVRQLDYESFIPKNFLKLRVFYKDLNYQNIIQTPDYELSQFLSDIGGTLGLWVGVTALSVIEIVDLLGQCMLVLCKR